MVKTQIGLKGKGYISKTGGYDSTVTHRVQLESEQADHALNVRVRASKRITTWVDAEISFGPYDETLESSPHSSRSIP